MRIVITGGTGFIGRSLVSSLLSEGHAVTVLTRSDRPDLPAEAGAVRWQAGEEADLPGEWRRSLDGADAVIHLAGESIAGGRWNGERKQRIYKSRIASTRALVRAIEGAENRPKVLLSGSAVGYYGPRGDEEITEYSEAGRDFLGRLCVDWEAAALAAEPLGVRVVRLRTGMVLERHGGALPRMLTPFRLFVGGPLGSGRQWMPWIHRHDLIHMIHFLIENEKATGAFNGTAPDPVTNREFSRILGSVLRRPSWAPVPEWVLRLLFGEMAEALLLSGQRALPAQALGLGFRFEYPELAPALRDILR